MQPKVGVIQKLEKNIEKGMDKQTNGERKTERQRGRDMERRRDRGTERRRDKELER
jgi:hypothetical protein